MHVWNITNLQAVLIVAAIGLLAWLVIRLVPGKYKPALTTFSEEEIQDCDRDIPKFFLAGGAALLLGSAHTVVKNIPGFWQWLWRAGYGGHLFRDAANSHLMIMGGGTILLLGITWYLLPRFTNRPLYSKTLANLSFWFISVGVLGSYLTWSILGLIEGGMVVQGWTYEAAKETLGLWHKLPAGASSGIMGIGFWIYIVNVYVTAGLAQHVPKKPLGFLTKFIIVSASAFLAGTIQGIGQSMSDSIAWLDKAGIYGQYIEPVSHVHMNILVGMFVALLSAIWYFGYRSTPERFTKNDAQLLFWGFTPAAIAFYAVFLITGLVVGNSNLGYGGLEIPALATWLESYSSLLQMIAGIWLFAGFSIYFIFIFFHFKGWKFRSLIADAKSSAFWLASVLLLVIGTIQGVLHIIPATAVILTVPDELSNIHAQLNMVGGVVLALIGVIYQILPEFLGTGVARFWRKRSLLGISSGILTYYLVTVAGGLLRYTYIRQGFDDFYSSLQITWLIPFLLLVSAIPILFGFYAFFKGLWEASRAYRENWFASLRRMPVRYSGPAARYQKYFPVRYFLLIELVFGIFGFPGLGWIFSGQALYGLILAVASPIILWVFIPILISVYDIHTYLIFGPAPMIIYIILSSLLSVIALWISLSRPGQQVEETGSR